MSEATEPPAAAPAPPPAIAPAGAGRGKGVIHDIGYARYVGERRSPSTLWRVIMRQQISYAWKTWWRWKPWLAGAFITVVVCGVIMYVSRNSMFDDLTREGGPLAFVDGVLSFSYMFLTKFGFFLSMTIGAAVVARDQETGAFAFYFSRPVRPHDYVIGKLAGMTVVMATVFLAGPLLLAIFRIGLAKDTAEMVRLLPWLGHTLIVGVLASLTYAAMPMAASALIGKRTIAIVVWAVYYIFGTGIFAMIGIFVWKPVAVLDPANAVQSLAFGLWKISMPGNDDQAFVSTAVAVTGLLLQAALGSGLFYWAVRRQATGAVGASS